jgi:AhpD family alkylhydroperoxidase
MEARMKNPAAILPGAIKGVGAIHQAVHSGGVPASTLELVHLRASQINGCGFCVHSASTSLQKGGESDERLWSVAAWRESPLFTEAERAALALAEAATRIADRGEVPDAVWDDAADHFDERGLSAIVLMIGLANLYNTINVTVRQPAGVTFY